MIVSPRLISLIWKELLMLLRDKQSRMIIVLPVLLQVAVFPFAATMEVTNASIGIYNEDNGRHSIEITQRLAKSASFSRVRLLADEGAARDAIDNQRVLLLLRFSPEFSRNLEEGKPASVLVILDGRRSNGGQIAAGYIQNIIADYQSERYGGKGISGDTRLEFRNWFNPNLDYSWFVLPSLVAMITTVGVLIITALSVAREREQGTLEQLLVSPLNTWQIFVGKAVPALIVATFQGSLILAASVWIYGIPFSGSLALFYLCMILYGLSLVGIGLLVSAVCSTQQQAFIGIFIFLMPAILLSGYISPVENMPEWLQAVTMANPVRHFTEITKQIYLKDAPFEVVWHSILPLLVIIVFSTGIAYRLFRRKIS